jgi:Zn-dependent peptidase ImmA (M78 family)
MGIKSQHVHEWEQFGRISFGHLDKLAHHTHTPVGYLYLPEPVDDQLPISDFRTVGKRRVQRPSPELLDTIHLMQRRQAWMREEVIADGGEPLSFVASVRPGANPVAVAGDMRVALGLEPHWARSEPTWTDALRCLRDHIEQAGVLVVFNGVVDNNTHRKLDRNEFCGFALVDPYAPLVFVNAEDFKTAQIFTLMHEVAHVWAGAGGVSGVDALQAPSVGMEQFCNRVAAEFLVPQAELSAVWEQAPEDESRYQFVAQHFKVSSIVAAMRAVDLGLVDRRTFGQFYASWQDSERSKRPAAGGGNFWNTQNVRLGKRFGAAVIRAVQEGRLLYRDAYSLTEVSTGSFDRFVEHFGA